MCGRCHHLITYQKKLHAEGKSFSHAFMLHGMKALLRPLHNTKRTLSFSIQHTKRGSLQTIAENISRRFPQDCPCTHILHPILYFTTGSHHAFILDQLFKSFGQLWVVIIERYFRDFSKVLLYQKEEKICHCYCTLFLVAYDIYVSNWD